MSGRYTVRPLRRDDAEAYRAVRLEGLKLAPEAFGSSFEEESVLTLEQFRARVPAADSPNMMFGGFDGDRLVGLAGFFTEPHRKKAHIGVLVGVYVRAEARGTGLSRRLVEAVIDRARGRVLILRATVGAANEPAKRLYASLGFKTYGLEKRGLRVGDTFHDEELIALELG